MSVKTFLSVCIFSLVSFCGYSQTCSLGVGGKHADMIIEVFQLNSAQIEKMQTARVTLDDKSKELENKMEKLLSEHPQSTPEDLTKMADKYNVLKAAMVQLSDETDKEVLATFNQKQYNRYLELCKETYRKPMVITPKVYQDSIAPK